MSTTGSDLILTIVLWVTGTFALLSVLLLFTAAMFRLRSRREESRELVIRTRWSPLITHLIAHGSLDWDGLPNLARADRKRFIEYWAVMHAYVRGSGDQAMNLLAGHLDMHKWLTPLLTHRQIRYRLAAVTALGYLGTATDKQIKRVEKNIANPNRFLSITALRCILNLDIERGIRALNITLAEKNWSDSRLISALREADQSAVLAELHASIETAPRRTALKCYRLCKQLRGYTDREESLTLLKRFPEDPAVAAQFLRLVNIPSLMPYVMPFLRHSEADIRALAIEAVGRLGTLVNMHDLTPRLDDEDPWVRYDAATSILLLPGMNASQITALLERLPESPGRIILQELYQVSQRGAA